MSRTPRPGLVSRECLPGAGTPGVCDHCMKPLPRRRLRWCSDECSWWYYDNHIWNNARTRVLERDNRTCSACGVRAMWEVDHIEAARGAHGKHSCIHHLDNLRVLCHACHVLRTNEQRKASR